MRRLIILNPKSRAGTARNAFRKLESELRAKLGDFDVYETTAPRDATDRVRQTLKAGAVDQIIVAGGDGTINEAVNGYFENGLLLSDSIPLAVISLGTGSDFIKTIRQVSAVYDVSLQKNQYRQVDVGLVSTRSMRHYFVNIASAGIAGKIMESLKSSKFQHGSPAYFYHTLKSLYLYHPELVEVEYVDEKGNLQSRSSRLLNFFACNGRFNGGGMNWAPDASIEDGVLDAVIIGGVSKTRMVLASSRIYAGQIEGFPGASQFRAQKILLRSKKLIQGEADGEVYSSEPPAEVQYEILPRTLPLVL
ncbi:MAG: diacylglycerol kinase family lipid kinase [Leptospiraceae bacterium]|nr:diacylglycerol kinase family lipid kinase [Leptospiraceae bacterium]MCB1303284.1 diacylglycerol kinase family lipid kinase [Leptospiraceae bacterium]